MPKHLKEDSLNRRHNCQEWVCFLSSLGILFGLLAVWLGPLTRSYILSAPCLAGLQHDKIRLLHRCLPLNGIPNLQHHSSRVFRHLWRCPPSTKPFSKHKQGISAGGCMSLCSGLHSEFRPEPLPLILRKSLGPGTMTRVFYWEPEMLEKPWQP